VACTLENNEQKFITSGLKKLLKD